MSVSLHNDTVKFLNARTAYRSFLVGTFVRDPVDDNGHYKLPDAENLSQKMAVIPQNIFKSLWDELLAARRSSNTAGANTPATGARGIPVLGTLEEDLVKLRSDPKQRTASADFESSLTRQARFMEAWRKADLHKRQRRYHHYIHYGEVLRSEVKDAPLWQQRLQDPFCRDPR